MVARQSQRYSQPLYEGTIISKFNKNPKKQNIFLRASNYMFSSQEYINAYNKSPVKYIQFNPHLSTYKFIYHIGNCLMLHKCNLSQSSPNPILANSALQSALFIAYDSISIQVQPPPAEQKKNGFTFWSNDVMIMATEENRRCVLMKWRELIANAIIITNTHVEIMAVAIVDKPKIYLIELKELQIIRIIQLGISAIRSISFNTLGDMHCIIVLPYENDGYIISIGDQQESSPSILKLIGHKSFISAVLTLPHMFMAAGMDMRLSFYDWEVIRGSTQWKKIQYEKRKEMRQEKYKQEELQDEQLQYEHGLGVKCKRSFRIGGSQPMQRNNAGQYGFGMIKQIGNAILLISYDCKIRIYQLPQTI